MASRAVYHASLVARSRSSECLTILVTNLVRKICSMSTNASSNGDEDMQWKTGEDRWNVSPLPCFQAALECVRSSTLKPPALWNIIGTYNYKLLLSLHPLTKHCKSFVLYALVAV